MKEKSFHNLNTKQQTICLIILHYDYQIYTILRLRVARKNCPILKKRNLLLNSFENVKPNKWCYVHTKSEKNNRNVKIL